MRSDQWEQANQMRRSETNLWNYPCGFDRPGIVQDYGPVVSARTAWSDPRRLAD